MATRWAHLYKITLINSTILQIQDIEEHTKVSSFVTTRLRCLKRYIHSSPSVGVNSLSIDLSRITSTAPSFHHRRETYELLTSTSTISDPRAPPRVILQGGYGSAGVWLEWMTYLHGAGYPGTLHAYSARSHGASYPLFYLRMVYGTSLKDMANDFKTCPDFARRQESSNEGRSLEVVLVGHSSGGGLVQYAIATGLVRCRALCLVDAVPHFGLSDVYRNWARHDPWFMLRGMIHLRHPSSPLSSTGLVQRAFFGHKIPSSKLSDSIRWMPAYERMGWPVGMMGSFSAWWRGSSRWLDIQNILRSIFGSEDTSTKDGVWIMVGSEDMASC